MFGKDEFKKDFVDVLMKKAFSYDAPPMLDFMDLQAKPTETDFDDIVPLNDEQLDFINAAGSAGKYDDVADDDRIE